MERPIDAGILQDNLTDIYGDGNRLVYLKDVLDLIDEQPTLTPPNEWVSVEERLPQLPTNSDWCSIMVITTRKNDTKSRLMIYERAIVRGKRVERWKYYWDKIADELPDYWMPLPEPPDSRPSED